MLVHSGEGDAVRCIIRHCRAESAKVPQRPKSVRSMDMSMGVSGEAVKNDRYSVFMKCCMRMRCARREKWWWVVVVNVADDVVDE